jgi:hypothetical protein
LQVLLDLLAGALAVNALPHLVKGITGQRHMTPFGRLSSAPVNVAWAFANILASLWVLEIASSRGFFALPAQMELAGLRLWAFLIGAFVTALWLARFWSDPNARLPWDRD